jgi:abortive infection bacteriophage resistance protein
LISEAEINSYIGDSRFEEYFGNPYIQTIEEALVTYKFDIQLRGLLISALGVLEVGLRAQLISKGCDDTFSSFGQARRILADSGKTIREETSRALGAKNYKQLRGALQNLNYLRNRVAHHERIWNHRNPFAFPDFGTSQFDSKTTPDSNRHLLAWSVVGIQHILNRYPELISFESQFENLIVHTPLDRSFLLKSMGFKAR